MPAPPPDDPTRDDPPPLPPVMPNLDDCCGQGCDPCVFDVYDAKRERYLAALRAWQARHPEAAPPDADAPAGWGRVSCARESPARASPARGRHWW